MNKDKKGVNIACIVIIVLAFVFFIISIFIYYFVPVTKKSGDITIPWYFWLLLVISFILFFVVIGLGLTSGKKGKGMGGGMEGGMGEGMGKDVNITDTVSEKAYRLREKVSDSIDQLVSDKDWSELNNIRRK